MLERKEKNTEKKERERNTTRETGMPMKKWLNVELSKGIKRQTGSMRGV
jgi:hypothetical protein